MGPLISKSHRRRVMRYIKKGVTRGKSTRRRAAVVLGFGCGSFSNQL